MDYKIKYFKYKNKYLLLKKGSGQLSGDSVASTFKIATDIKLLKHDTDISDVDLAKLILPYIRKYIIANYAISPEDYDKSILNFHNNIFNLLYVSGRDDFSLLSSSGDGIRDNLTNIEQFIKYDIHMCLPEFVREGDEPFYIYNSSSDNIEIQDMATIDEKRKNHYILNLNRIIKNITALLDYNKSELNVNKKILCFIDYDNVIHTNKLIEIFQNKCILFNTLEPRFNLPINIIIILLKIDGRLEELKGSILEDIKQYKLIDNNYVIEKFILNKSTLIREK